MSKIRYYALSAMAGLVTLLLAVAALLSKRLEQSQAENEALARKNEALNETRRRIEQAHVKNRNEQQRADRSVRSGRRDYFE